MKTAAAIVQNAVRLLGLTLIVLGFLFWSRTAFSFIPLHMRLGETLVALLWILAILGIVAKAPAGLIAAAILWGLVVVGFGMNMGGFLPGRAHEVIRVAHFLIGLAAIGLAESLAARIKRALSRSPAA
jgi:ABC-type long-subunit fatty acid transport system fused permease/ATPase subunit